ncbi:MAG: AI-2E family transporter [Eubacteriaceae bacterium]|nr:AI-2E family transporter [Eubacteriaceae bacterium]MDD4507840.1 AI-2E family transporter [Eubacteriaceae bacterium]
MNLSKHNIHIMAGLIVLALLLWAGLQNFSHVLSGIGWVIGLIFPFLLGGAIAFIINIPMRLIEDHLFIEKRVKKYPRLEKAKRPLSLILALVAIGIVFAIIFFIVVPQFGKTALTIKDRVPVFIQEAQVWADSMGNRYVDIADFVKKIAGDWSKIQSSLGSFFQKSFMSVVNSTFDVAGDILSGAVNFGIGFIFSLYVLLQKEKLGFQFRKLVYTFFKRKTGDAIVNILDLTANVFQKFITGQCTEAVIIVVLFSVTMSLFRFPYALMIAVLIGTLSLIPIFGAFIGCFIGALLLFINSPIQAIEFVILFIIIQQIEGNLIYPHVVGGSVGLPSIWVLVAVTIGGNAWGVSGMILTIPLCSVLYIILREYVAIHLKQKNIPDILIQNGAKALRKSDPPLNEEEKIQK